MKSKKIIISGYYSIILFLFLIIIDKITKIWALTLTKEIDHGILAFTLAMNTGAGFSILKDSNTLLIGVAIIALGAIIYFKDHFPKSGFTLIAAGIFGNLIDRISYGYVVDFINFKFWPIFNAADSFIFIGVVITAIVWWREDAKEKREIIKKNNDSKTNKKRKSEKNKSSKRSKPENSRKINK